MKNIAWIGTGHMGLPMAHNLLKEGYNVQVYNRTIERAQPLAEAGATLYASPVEAIAQAEAVFIMLTKKEAIDDVLSGEQGILSQLRAGTYVINMSTISPEEAKEFAEQISAQGAIYVDAPVSGSVAPAEQGTLVILAGGQTAEIEACQPFFDILGKKTIHFGEVGNGSAAKLSINLLLGISTQAIAESLLIAERSGLQREQVLEMFGESAVATPLLAGKKEMFIHNEFPAAFMLSLISKDLGLLTTEAKRLNLQLPLAEAADRTYREANNNGKGELDLAAIWLELQERHPKSE
ncbi:NAD(P)-dependent oxidoreductase [Paenibacillus sp. CFBP13512]|uniref:NAD(P)-dependent oxidoreductase n=1 Tax=Paenibacillus sp. CFBP13512 TaxID=2184007 RepID=UPI0010BFC985|nr:NAD(P)-dependent oxidoreductase [Paenibacillus sp. CFBP13512]TKJ89802.1 NAD(P)-dependent oxidoreductase [Paenibacillus sp. CFBP13512]